VLLQAHQRLALFVIIIMGTKKSPLGSIDVLEESRRPLDAEVPANFRDAVLRHHKVKRLPAGG